MDTILGARFELQARAASGGMGSVWRARDLNTGNLVAVKVLTLDRPFDIARFERECQVLANLRHDNVVRYVAHGVTNNVHYLVQEWVDGVTLSTHLTTIGATAQEAVTIAIGIAEALGAAHDAGVVHRDVKPANVILEQGRIERVKLVDFGIARMATDAGVLTRTGVLIGTPSYMAPEQARGSINIAPTADVWALGCVLYEMLCGRKAFAGRTPEAVRTKVLLTNPESVAICCPEAPAQLCELVDSMLAKTAEARPNNGSRAAALLRSCPAVDGGPRRRTGAIEQQPTAVVSSRKPATSAHEGAANCFVYFTAPPAGEGEPSISIEPLEQIAARHNLELHALEDGSVIMRARSLDQEGANAVAAAACELKQEMQDGAVSIFAQGSDETLADALERGAEVQAQHAMENLFADALEVERTIRIDDALAKMLCDEAKIDRTDAGAAVLREYKNRGAG